MTTLDYDVVIVGSGAAGGVLAERLSPLAKQGARIAMLEAGPYYARESFTQREDEMSKLFWSRGAFYVRDGSLSIAAGRCVGGSTTVYTAVTFRTPRAVLENWQRNYVGDLDPADFDHRFARLERELEVGEMPEERVNENNRLFRAGCQALGWKCLPIRLAATLECNGCGFCNLGCWNGSKKSTLEVHIPRALEQGVELIPTCTALQVSEKGVVAMAATPPPDAVQWKTAPGLALFRAKLVILAAGALHTPAILQRSTLPKQSPALGRFMTLHPAVTLSGILPHEVLGFRGYPKTFYTDEFAESHHYLLETAFYFPGVTAKNLPGFGLQHQEWMKQYRRFMSAIVLELDEPDEANRLTSPREGPPVLDYRLSEGSVNNLVHSMRSAAKVFFAAGAETALIPASRTGAVRATASAADLEDEIHPRFFRRGQAPIASAHPQGGCRMGRSIENSVVDSYGRLHGARNIFVCDASVFPTSAKVNPYLSVMALADRTAEYLMRNISQWV
ncbi:MAG: GMC family oxidoreductase N-terminal domain-containing protein [Terriglobia bacterium]